MRQDAWRAYLEMALGVTEASRKKALKAAKKVVGKSEAKAEQLQSLADELVRASAANREAVAQMIRVELDRALGAVGLAKAEEVEALSVKVRDLEAELHATARANEEIAATTAAVAAARRDAAEARGTSAAEATLSTADGATPTAAPVKKTAAKKAVAKNAVAKRTPAATNTAKPATPNGAVVKKAVAKKTVAKKAVKKATATPPEAN